MELPLSVREVSERATRAVHLHDGGNASQATALAIAVCHQDIPTLIESVRYHMTLCAIMSKRVNSLEDQLEEERKKCADIKEDVHG